MKNKIILCICNLSLPLLCHAVDIALLKGGERRPCVIAGVEGETVLVETRPVPDFPPVSVRIPRNQISGIEFGPDAQRDALIQKATLAQLPELKLLWERFAPLLNCEDSPSARIGLRYGLVLLESDNTAQREWALPVFAKIAEYAWHPNDRDAARQGKLRALMAINQVPEAVAAASELLKSDAALSPPLAAEARLILGKNTEAELRQLLEENPRWEEDDAVRTKRNRLYHCALDLYLLPALLPDVSPELALRGLWGAFGIHRLCGDQALAAETARDLIAFYPSTTFAKESAKFLDSLPAELRNSDSERDARDAVAKPIGNKKHENASSSSSSQAAPTASAPASSAPHKRKRSGT